MLRRAVLRAARVPRICSLPRVREAAAPVSAAVLSGPAPVRAATRRPGLEGESGVYIAMAYERAYKGMCAGAIADEALVPRFALPEALRTEDGAAVASADAWHARRRPELLELFREHVYGRTPAAPVAARHTVLSSAVALDGLAVRTEIALQLTGDTGVSRGWTVLLYLPADAVARGAAAPCLLALNFSGNQTVHADPGITPSSVVEEDFGAPHRVVRGAAAHHWQVERVLRRGFALATVYSGEIAPDRADTAFSDGVHALFEPDETHTWGSIAAWAWGLSRTLDLLETLPEVDHTKCAVAGHSRKGKAALWAGAEDERFALVISNNSGCGGAALSRRAFGETVALITHRFPHWFAEAFRRYGAADLTHRPGNEQALPVDQHELIALIAPRPVYVASAEDDWWADPRGEWQATAAAEPVYRLLGTAGLGGESVADHESAGPATDVPMGVECGAMGYHRRSGKHDVTAFDWDQYLAFAERHLLPRRQEGGA